ncbi:MAG: hypothetical protein JWP52_2814 [Rhizobacter sp.]|nr:hypothetical protein [Rhizobacter sp.]
MTNIHRLRTRHLLCVLALTSLHFTSNAQAQPAPLLPQDLTEQLKKLQNMKVQSPVGGDAKGWTCRDPEDGHRMHVVDTTNIARMGKVPSSVAGLNDTKTEPRNLPLCERPQ